MTPPAPLPTAAHPPETSAPSARPPVVAVFDSGVGGLSVVPSLRAALPSAHLLVMADSAHAPYGERDDAWIRRRCTEVAASLRAQGADMLVVACNTATAAAVPELRRDHPGWPIVGIEPGVKPARLVSRSGRIGVMATDATLRSERFNRLLADHGMGAFVVAQACTGLALAIEHGDQVRMAELVAQHTQPLRQAEVDVVVLGCTHYPFIRQQIAQAMGPGVQLVDTAEAVARRAAALLVDWSVPAAASVPNDRVQGSAGTTEFWTSGEPRQLEQFAKRWLGWTVNARAWRDGGPI